LKIYLSIISIFITLLFSCSPSNNTITDGETKSNSTIENQLEAQNISEENQNLTEGISYNEVNHTLIYKDGTTSRTFSAWFSLLPPLIAIILALVIKEVHIALVTGIFFGVFTINGFQLNKIFSSFFEIADTYVLKAIAYTNTEGELQTGHLSIIVFSVMIGGMVHIISSNGGMNGVVAKVSKLATSARRTQFATMLMGGIIFFDDYANTLVVGNTMRPLTDKFKISREKLAYIVDSTAAPVAAIAFVTTWIGYQLSEIERGIAAQNLVEINQSAYSLFLGSLKYSYYPIFTLFFILLIIFFKKDFGPMLQAEQAAFNGKTKHSKSHKTDITTHWLNAGIPVFTLITTVLVGLLITGYNTEIWQSNLSFFVKLRDTLGNADSYIALIWASFLSCVVAIFVSILSKSLDVKESIDALIEGFKSMVPAVVILILAWALAAVIENLYTADFISSLVPQNFNAYWLPAIFFIFSAIISFSTGSSWNTMAVMYPICIPIVLKVATANGVNIDLDFLMPVLLNTISVILAASVLGDHCSPISDTTILSSLSSDCNHINHVRTQLPYALSVGLISLFCGGILFAFGLPWYILYLIGFATIYGMVHLFGKKINRNE